MISCIFNTYWYLNKLFTYTVQNATEKNAKVHAENTSQFKSINLK